MPEPSVSACINVQYQRVPATPGVSVQSREHCVVEPKSISAPGTGLPTESVTRIVSLNGLGSVRSSVCETLVSSSASYV